ncbi:MAG TPA: replication initiator [Streptosporangiaceae bacterium]|nr:replication initiator [Streptosporangiaceae bacterium]
MTDPGGAAAPIVPEPHPGSGPVATADDVTTCAHPIRLTGRITAIDRATGQTADMFRTWTEYQVPAAPGFTETVRSDSPLYVDCGNRREEVCPHCSRVYKRDARQVVLSGLSGGKGVPDSVADHPCVFATFTAPSFGPVHARRERGGKVLPCRPRRDASKRACPHGRDISCPVRHSPDDPRLGRPMCPDCYDYESAVTFNAGVPKLWQRFLTYLPRHLARLAGIRVKDCRELVRHRVVKVSEYQLRGVIHFHAVIRLDANVKDETAFIHPGPQWTAELLAAAVKGAARQASAHFPVGNTGRSLVLRFGAESGFADTRIIRSGTAAAISREAVANYIAKYVTKAVGIPGLPNFRIRHLADIASLRCSAHHRQLIETAYRLGFRRYAHQLGYGGHPITKSRRYSVTFGRIRRERAEWRKAQRWPDGELDPWGRPLDDRIVLVVKDFTYLGTGYTPRTPSAELALASADMARGN